VVHPGGAVVALRTKLVGQVLRSGRPVLLMDAFVSNPVRVQKQRWDQYFLSYNRTDHADRVQDILTALAFLKTQDRGTPELIGLGEAGIWRLFAAAIVPMALDVVADLKGFSGSDQDFRDRFFVPGIQRAGGLSAALRLVNRLSAMLPAQRPAGQASSEAAGE
jgi:hypothetical protein